MFEDMFENVYNEKMVEILGASVWGQPIDINNVKQVAVAFYLLGKDEQRKFDYREYDHETNTLMGIK